MKDHKKLYGIYIRSSIFVSIILFILGFLFVPMAEVEPYQGRIGKGDLIIDIFTQTQRPDRPKPPDNNRPRPAVADMDNNQDGVVKTIGQTIFDEPFSHAIKKLDVVPYYKAQIQPIPIKTPAPEYPSIVLKAGIEGICTIEGVIDTTGKVIEVKIYKSSGNTLLDQAAVNAFKTYEFVPAYARDHPVAVWIRMPVAFKLKG